MAGELGRLIARKRRAMTPPLSQSKLGEDAGIDRTHVSRIETGSIQNPEPQLMISLLNSVRATMKDLEDAGLNTEEFLGPLREWLSDARLESEYDRYAEWPFVRELEAYPRERMVPSTSSSRGSSRFQQGRRERVPFGNANGDADEELTSRVSFGFSGPGNGRPLPERFDFNYSRRGAVLERDWEAVRQRIIRRVEAFDEDRLEIADVFMRVLEYGDVDPKKDATSLLGEEEE